MPAAASAPARGTVDRTEFFWAPVIFVPGPPACGCKTDPAARMPALKKFGLLRHPPPTHENQGNADVFQPGFCRLSAEIGGCRATLLLLKFRRFPWQVLKQKLRRLIGVAGQVPPAHPTVKQVVAVQTKPRQNNDVFLFLFIFTQW